MDKYSDNELIIMKNSAELTLPYFYKSSIGLGRQAFDNVVKGFENTKRILADIYAELEKRGVEFDKLYPDVLDWTFDKNLESRKK